MRFIAATNRDLEAEVARGAFRARPLLPAERHHADDPAAARARLEEIAPLAETFVRQICRDLGRASRRCCRRASDRSTWRRYGWPGNIRELKNVIERAVLLCAGPDARTAAHAAGERAPQPRARSSARPRRPTAQRRARERDRIIEALAACAGNQSRAAKMLGIPRRTFVSKLDAYRIPRPRRRSRPWR